LHATASQCSRAIALRLSLGAAIALLTLEAHRAHQDRPAEILMHAAATAYGPLRASRSRRLERGPRPPPRPSASDRPCAAKKLNAELSASAVLRDQVDQLVDAVEFWEGSRRRRCGRLKRGGENGVGRHPGRGVEADALARFARHNERDPPLVRRRPAGVSRRSGSCHARAGGPHDRPRSHGRGSAPRRRLAPAGEPPGDVGAIAVRWPSCPHFGSRARIVSIGW
jgi:hypothetical protein